MYHKRKSYDVWFLRYWMGQTGFFIILDHFWHFYNPNNPKSQHFEKIKKPPGGIIILHMSNINDNHIMYGSWDMECDRQNFLSFWTVFCPFTPLTMRKSKFWKMKKPPGDIIILHICTINDNYVMYGSWHMEHDRQNLSFWTVFCRFTPLITQKIKILKNWKKCLEISSFYTSIPKIMIICYWDMEHNRCNCYFSFCAIFALLPP